MRVFAMFLMIPVVGALGMAVYALLVFFREGDVMYHDAFGLLFAGVFFCMAVVGWVHFLNVRDKFPK